MSNGGAAITSHTIIKNKKLSAQARDSVRLLVQLQSLSPSLSLSLAVYIIVVRKNKERVIRSDGAVLLAGRRLVARREFRAPRRGPGGPVMMPVMRRRGCRSSGWWRWMHHTATAAPATTVGCVVALLAARRRRGRSVLLLLQQLTELLDRLVQRPELREQRQVQLAQSELERDMRALVFWGRKVFIYECIILSFLFYLSRIFRSTKKFKLFRSK